MAMWAMLAVAAAGFFCLFSPWTQAVPFWPVMTTMALGLSVGSLVIDRKDLKPTYEYKLCYLPVGLASAAVLYLVFWMGNLISTQILPFAAAQVDSIYAVKAGQNRWLIAALLAFVIGPGEEIFWRGFIQRRLSNKYGVLIGFLAATAMYVLVHIWSFNLMLLLASAICGAFWGLMFAATGKLWPVIISHAVWDITVFILLPIR
ncbi:MAG: lysostaphin resistance A-like protein [Planctomycetota bacterium]|jgi:membrane protease YdiL (CAAX protease family)